MIISLIKCDYKEFYPLLNTHEFIAGVFHSKPLQKALNEVDTTAKKSIWERIISAIARALLRLTRRTKSTTQKWDNLFRSRKY